MINNLRFFQVMMIFSVAIGAGIMVTIYYLHNNPASPTIQHENEFIGVIAEIEESRFLVVNGLSVEEIKNLSVDDIIEESEGASWFTADVETLSTLKIYDQVKVYYSGMDDSYPGSGEAEKVEKLD